MEPFVYRENTPPKNNSLQNRFYGSEDGHSCYAYGSNPPLILLNIAEFSSQGYSVPRSYIFLPHRKILRTSNPIKSSLSENPLKIGICNLKTEFHILKNMVLSAEIQD